MKSMTGFGRAEITAPFGRVIVEIQSVNRKYFEVQVSLPKDYHRFENEIRKVVSDTISRGSLSVRIYVLPISAETDYALPNVDLLRPLKASWENVAVSLGYQKEVIDFHFLLRAAADIPQLKEIKEVDFDSFKDCIKQALTALQEMKKIEGAALAVDIQDRLQEIGKKITAIEKGSPDAVQKMRLKLKERMEELLTPGAALDERLLRETALYAERLDISEEITRFRSHIAQYTELLKSKEASGRKMDFLIQEMGREINTMGSKSMDAAIAHLVVEVKAELEKVREQIQNIE